MTDEMIADLWRQTCDTALKAGIPIISDDKCCRLLAWLLVYGGGCEAVIYNRKLNADIIYAQKRLNIIGGEIPDAALIPKFQRYAKSIKDENRPPSWVPELESEYGLKIRR